MVRLLAFALISEPIFDWAFYRVGWNPFSQNVFLTLALGLLGIWGFETCSHRQPSSALVPFQWLAWMSPVATSLSAHVLNTDYGWYGVSLITLFYFTDFSPLKKESDSHRGWIRFLFMGGLTLLFLEMIQRYRGQRGTPFCPNIQSLFYWLYLIHLLLLATMDRIWH